MRLVTYLVVTGIGCLLVGALGVYVLLVGGAAGVLGLLLIIVAAFGYLLNYIVIRAQLDRHEGSVPMPGVLGWFFDVDDDAADEDSDDDWTPAYPADSDGDLAGDTGGTEILSTCPSCGLRELRRPGAPCRVCGHAFAGDPAAGPPVRPIA